MSHTTVADVIVDGLRRAGVARLFSVAGAESPLLRAVARHAIERVAAARARSACVMAAVTGELTGAPGVALLAGGAGAAAGVRRACDDRAPVIVLTEGGGESLTPFVKASLTAAPASAAHWIAHALQLAMNYPRGPVHVNVASDVDAAAVPVATVVQPAPLPPPDVHALDVAVRLLTGASRPAIVVGGQCRSAQSANWLRAFAETLPAPVLVTLKAKGVLPDPHPLVLGLLGAETGAVVLAQADLVVALGLEPVEVDQWTPHAPVLHLGPSGPEGGLGVAAARVVGEISLILEEIAPRLRGARRADWDVAELDRLKRRFRAPGSDGGLTPSRVASIAREMTLAGTIAAVDGGENMREVAAAWQAVAPREFFAPNRLAAVGVALPAALAAQLAHADRCVLAFTTRAGLAASRAELETVAGLAAPIVVLVLVAGPWPAESHAPVGPVPAACESESTLRSALARALKARQPVVLGIGVRGEPATV